MSVFFILVTVLMVLTVFSIMGFFVCDVVVFCSSSCLNIFTCAVCGCSGWFIVFIVCSRNSVAFIVHGSTCIDGLFIAHIILHSSYSPRISFMFFSVFSVNFVFVVVNGFCSVISLLYVISCCCLYSIPSTGVFLFLSAFIIEISSSCNCSFACIGMTGISPTVDAEKMESETPSSVKKSCSECAGNNFENSMSCSCVFIIVSMMSLSVN